jgi:DNA topoisomerase IA
VVRRDREIEAFQPRAYYAVRAGVWCAAGPFVATWLAAEAGGPEIDDAGRLLSAERASEIRRAAEGRPAVVVGSSRERKTEAPPRWVTPAPVCRGSVQTWKSAKHLRFMNLAPRRDPGGPTA